MIIFPAVDIQGGKAVRLRQGKKDEATIYAENPVELALRWRDAGAEWLHVVDLDGAFEGRSENLALIAEIVKQTRLPVQVGGGIRTAATAARYFNAGVTRLIIGTMALENPDTFRELCQTWQGRIGVSLDGERGRLKSRGWLKDAQLTIPQILPQLEEAGAAFIIYTDIERDGTQAGANLAALQQLLHKTRLPVISAGGIATLQDIINISSLSHFGNLEGVISGRAICEGNLDLAEATRLLSSLNQEN